MPLDPNHLTALRNRVNASFLPDTCVIYRKTYTTGADGRPTVGQEPLETTVCKVDPMGGTVRDQIDVSKALGRETLEILYRITTPYDSELAEDCEVVTNDKTYQVVQLDDMQTWSLGKRAIIAEVR